MKKMKNLLALLLAAILVVGSVFSASAADENADITMSNAQTGHTYNAYQIFAGTVATNGEISITGWGEAITDGNAFLTALKADPTIGQLFQKEVTPATNPATYEIDVKTPEAAAKVVSTMTADQLVAFAKVADDCVDASKKRAATEDPAGTYKWTDIPNGYWLVLDQTENLADTTDYLSANIMKVAGQNVTIEKKGTPSTSDKGVTDTATSATAPTTHIEVNNVQANIGDKVFYTLKGTTSTGLDKYDQYQWTFEDTLPAGITFYQIENVYVDGVAIPQADWADYKVEVTEPTTKATAEQAAGTADAPAAGGGSLTVKYTLKTPAKPDGTRDIDRISDNASAINLLVVYSAVVNQAATQGGTYDATTNTMHAKFTNDPNGNGEGKTKDEKAVVYQVKLDLEKVSNSDTTKKLAGAEFILHRTVNNTPQYAVLSADGTVLRWVTNHQQATKITTGPEGGTYVSPVIKGLESGSYVLYETKAPEGYSQPAEWNSFSIPFTITATGKDPEGAEGAGLADLSLDVTGVTGVAGAEATDAKVSGTDTNAGNGSISLGQVDATVKNSNKLTLPSTGGIGTTLFYVIGALLVIGCAVLFVGKRRISE